MNASGHRSHRSIVLFVSAFALVASAIVAPTAPAVAEDLRALEGSTLPREATVTPEALADGLLEGLQYPDPGA